MVAAQDFDYIAGGPPERPRRRWPLLVLAVASTVALVLAVALIADWGARNVEMNSLVTAIESSERAMTETQDAVNAVLAKADGEGQITPDQRQAILDELAVVAQQGRDAVAAAGRRVADVRVLPWNRAIVDARTSYLAHNQAWIDYLSSAAEDPLQFFQPQPAVNDTFYAARAPMEDAVPVPALFDLKERVQAIYAESSDDATEAPSSGGTPAVMGSSS